MRAGTLHECCECGATSPKWLGRCHGCGAWGSLSAASSDPANLTRPVPLVEVDPDGAPVFATGVGELDRVLGGGLVEGSVSLLGGAPGIGKSTLCLQVAAAVASTARRVLVVCAEESPEQVRRRAGRLGPFPAELFALGTSSLTAIGDALDTLEPTLVVVDSIQAVADPDVSGAAGSVAQVREGAQRLAAWARERAIAIVLVGHVTKDGAVAGPRVLEHLVDTVISFEGDRHHALRTLRALKHRFAATDEVGLLELTAAGLVEVADASARLLAERGSAPGSVVVPTLDGSRPLLVELQALVARATGPAPRRVATGIDARRLAILVAVLERRGGVGLAGSDLFANAAGGTRVGDAAADLALAAAITGARTGRCTRESTVALGEIGLGGELRAVSQPARRLAEAMRLGYTRAVVPQSTPDVVGIELVRASTLDEGLATVLEAG